MAEYGPELHVVLGWEPDTYERALAASGKLGMPFSTEPRYHCHPALGILGHAHGPTITAARTRHTHRPVVEWDMDPVPVS